MSVMENLINNAIDSGLIDVVERDHAYLLRIKILGTWISLTSIAKAKAVQPVKP